MVNISTEFNHIDLRKLAEISAPDRAFLSLYLSGPEGMAALVKIIRTDRALLKDHPDELEYFDRNMKTVEDYFKKNPHKSGSLCIFACWILDFFEVYTLPVAVPDLLWVDSSPYIRPLAELQDEYENYAVVVADNRLAKVFLVASTVARREVQITGNVKNHVKVGGWSQQRYERRRDKQLQDYAKDIADELLELDRENAFRRVLMVGLKKRYERFERPCLTRSAGRLWKIRPWTWARATIGWKKNSSIFLSSRSAHPSNPSGK